MNIDKEKSNKYKKMPNHSQCTYLITLFALIILIFRNGTHTDQYVDLLKNLILIGLPSPLIRRD
jgi:hypothetical protein